MTGVWRAAAAASLLGTCAAEVVILTDVEGVVPAGTVFETARFNFSPKEFAPVRARVEYVHRDEFSYGSCPPVYKPAAGAAPARERFEGTVVLHDSASFAGCSYEQHARALGAVGAVAWLYWDAGAVSLGPAPGAEAMAFNIGDTRALETPVAHDMTNAAAVPFVAALRAGEALVVEVRPSVGSFEAARGTWFYAAVPVVLGLQGLVVLDLTAARLATFLRADGGFQRRSIAHWVLLLELWANSLRLVCGALDPFATKGVLPFPVFLFFWSHSIAVGACTTVQFLSYFLGAAAKLGVANLYMTGQPHRRRLLVFAAFILVLDLVLRILLIVDYSFLVYLAYGAGAVIITPLTVFVMSVFTWRRVSASIAALDLPPLLHSQLTRRMRWTIASTGITLVSGVFVPYCYYQPRLAMPVCLIFVTSLNVTSYVQASAFQPVGASTPVVFPIHRALHSIAWTMRGVSNRVRPASQASPARVSSPRPRSPLGRSAGSPIPETKKSEGDLPARMILGVTVTVLKELADAHNFDAQTPTTALTAALSGGEKEAWAERNAARVTSDGMLAVGEACIFVSHAQKCSFRKLIAALELHCKHHRRALESTYFWIDVFCIRQNAVAHEVRWIGPALGHIGSVVVVLDPWDKPVCLTRAWCLFEVVTASHGTLMQPHGHHPAQDDAPATAEAVEDKSLGGKVGHGQGGEMDRVTGEGAAPSPSLASRRPALHLTMAPEEREGCLHALRADPNAVTRAVSCVNTREAGASNPADAAMIQASFRDNLGNGSDEMAYAAVDAIVHRAILRATAAASWSILT